MHGAVLELLADRGRQLRAIDPDGRLLTLSCGAALHHARTALAGAGYDVVVDRFPDARDADLLARLRLAEGDATRPPDSEALDVIRRRRTDRRPFAANVAVPERDVSSMQRAAEQEGAWMFQVPASRVPSVAAAADRAAAAEANMADYQSELEWWTHRPLGSGEGVPAETLTAQLPRTEGLHNFTSGRGSLLDPGFGDDRFAEFFIIATATDTPLDWLRAGEATSAVWLTATVAGLVASVMSDVIEIPEARMLLRRLLDRPGWPQLVFRVGVNMQPQPPPESPRRAPDLTLARG